MPRKKTGGGRRDRAKLSIQLWDEFAHQRLADRPIVGRIGEDVMAQRTTRIEHDPQEFDAAGVLLLYGDGRLLPMQVCSAEAGNLEDDRIAPFRMIIVTGGELYGAPHWHISF